MACKKNVQSCERVGASVDEIITHMFRLCEVWLQLVRAQIETDFAMPL